MLKTIKEGWILQPKHSCCFSITILGNNGCPTKYEMIWHAYYETTAISCYFKGKRPWNISGCVRDNMNEKIEIIWEQKVFCNNTKNWRWKFKIWFRMYFELCWWFSSKECRWDGNSFTLWRHFFKKIIRLQNIATISSIFTKENYERSALFWRLDWQ